MLFLVWFLFSTAFCVAQNALTEEHREVALRMIGHEVLLSLGDSTSRVLPIEKTENRYKIPFETEFAINPEEMAATITRVAGETKLAEHFIVLIEDAQSEDIVYSYEVGNVRDTSIVPCKARDLPEARYNILVTILDQNESVLTGTSAADTAAGQKNLFRWPIALLAFLLFAGGTVFMLRRKPQHEMDLNTVTIGDFKFDSRKMELSLNGKTIELTSKECALLQLLYDSANNTVERDTILRMVWDDEGDYVGRTLDVFISKLRKKLEADSKVKIANIRGIGYKLIVSN